MPKNPVSFTGRKTGETFVLSVDVPDLDDTARATVFFSKNAPFRFRVLDCWVQLNAAGVASGTLTLQQGDGAESESFTAISDAMSTNTIGDRDVIRAGEINDAGQVVAASESLAVLASGNNHNFRINVLCVREDL